MFEDLIAEERRKAKQNSAPPLAEPKAVDVADPGLSWADVRQAGKAAILPTLGQAAGTIGGMYSGPLAPVLVPTLESLGGMGGEYLNQKLGITEPSMEAIAVQGVIPPVFRGAAALKRVIPGSTAGARTLNEIARPEAEYQLGRFAAPDDAPYWAAADRSRQMVPTGSALQEAVHGYMNMSGSSGDDLYTGTRDYLGRLASKLMHSQGRMVPSEYQKELRDLGARITGAEGRRVNSVEEGHLTRVKDALEDALFSAPAGSDLAMARTIYAKKKVFEDIERVTARADKNLAGQGEQTQFNAAEVLRKLETDPKISKRFQAAYSPEEQHEIKNIYRFLNTLPKLPPAQGVNAGSFNMASDIRSALMTGGLMHMLDMPKSVVIPVAIASMVARPTLETAKVFSTIMQTHEGRKLLLNELRNAEGKTAREILEKAATALTGSQPAQEAIRDFSTTVQPFENER